MGGPREGVDRMSDFLLELRCEEIPARMQAGARRDLEKAFRDHMSATGVTHGELTVWSTPRRLALIARNLPQATLPVREELKGPKVSAPPQALEGFLKKVGLTQDQLEQRDGIYFAVIEKPGRETSEILTWAIAAIVRTFPWPKSMRWGAASVSTESPRWVRPLSGIVAIFGQDLVEVTAAGVASGLTTRGHCFHAPGQITLGEAHDYQEKLRACHVIVDHAEREALIRNGAALAAASAGLTLVTDEGLVIENAGLTEWPMPLLGRFDEAYLQVPPEVIQLTARINQKYFICSDAAGKLANAFICTANIAAHDRGAAIINGNRKVLAARLSDARFFWDQDRKKTLAQHAEKLSNIVFHEQLGTVADKVERVAKLAEWLATEGIIPGCDPALARQAAMLCKADLVTEMVGEFPELQGVMGGYYARAEGLSDEVADAIRDHYKPVGQGDEVPTAPVTVAVSLADKLDNLFSFFKVDLLPTGSKDPFALRRAGLGYLGLIEANGFRLHLQSAAQAWGRPFDGIHGLRVADFLFERLGVKLKDEGVRHDFIQASRAWEQGSDIDGCLDRVEARARALGVFLRTTDGINLLAGYKRATNILKKEGVVLASAGMIDKPLSYPPELAEKALIDSLDAAIPTATAALAAENFGGAMAALASLRAPIDAFFEEVIVNDPDPAKRAARLALLARFRDAVHQVADFSKIEG